MGEISWTDLTANPVIGCSKVSAECASCYAESQGASMSRRFANGAGKRYLQVIDGKRWNGQTYVDHDYMNRTTVTRRKRVPGYEGHARRWRRARVFMGSMTDMFHETLDFAALAPVWRWMAQHGVDEPGPIWQLVTKRPHRAVATLAALQHHASTACGAVPTIHLLTTVGHPDSLPRMDHLLACHGIPGVEVLGVSAEPLLAPVDFRPWLASGRIGWIIPGGESGPRARPCDIAWIRDIVAQCREHDVPCWVKQLGKAPTIGDGSHALALRDPSGSDPQEWPEDLRVQEWPPG